jgi:hypothetical protein
MQEAGRMHEKEFLRRLVEEAQDTVDFLSSARKRERERQVCAAFLRCAGVPFSPRDLKCPERDPPDVLFDTAAFEVKLLLGGRKIHGQWKAIAARQNSAQCIGDVLEPNVQAEPFSFAELVQAVTDELNKQTYDPRTREVLDALLYVNLKGRFLDVQSPYTNTAAIEQMGWRTVSVLSPPYALVLTASPSAPVFLRQRVATVRNCCSNPDEWFEL